MRTLLLVLLAACSTPSDTEDPVDTAPVRTPGDDATVEVFDAAWVQFGDENHRSIDIEVEFPDDTTTYSQLTGHFRLHCPNDRCDWWDRYGTFGIVENAGTEDERYIELDRFVTAYRVGHSWDADLTDMRPLLTGTRTLRVFIDTWVGEGHANGDGWLFDAAIDFVGGPPPSPEPIAVLPAWGHLSWRAGLPEEPVDTQVPAQTVPLPEDTTSLTLRSFISGHGWNNAQNCAEFCAKEHTYTVGDASFTREVWRDDCHQTETDGTQQGTWKYARAGWCPGAQVFPWDMDASEAIADEVDVTYALEPFTWNGDGDQPYYYMSGVLIAYR